MKTADRPKHRERSAGGLRPLLCVAFCLVLSWPASGAAAGSAEHAADGAVRTEVRAGARIAASVVWPSVGTLVSDEVSREALRVALRVAHAAATPSEGEPVALLRDEGGTLAAGFEIASSSEAPLIEALAALASPGLPGTTFLERALEDTDRGLEAERPIDAARRAVLDRLSGLGERAGSVDAASVRRALERLRAAPVRVVALGRTGLADRVASRLDARLGRPAAAGRPELPRSRSGAVLPGDAESTVLVFGFRVPAALAAELGAAVPLVAEVLRDGPGSLRQRLAVAIDAPSVVRASLQPLAGATEGALLIELGVPPERAERAFEVLDGAIASFGALPPRENALVEARARLDASAAGLRGDAGREVMSRMLLPASWAWPPEDRWSSPLRPEAFARAARSLLAEERSAIAAAGRVPRSLAERPPLAARSPVETGASDPGALFARVARRLLPGGLPGVEHGFASRYEIVESTPLGTVRAALQVSRRDGEVDIVREGPVGRRFPRAVPVTAPRPVRERRLAMAMRQPATFITLAEGGFAVVDETRLPCDAGSCPTLVAELEDGTRLELVIDGATFEPLELRTRWCCGGGAEVADETLRYVDWVENDGVRLASRMRAGDASGGERDVVLVDWIWLRAADDASEQQRENPR